MGVVWEYNEDWKMSVEDGVMDASCLYSVVYLLTFWREWRGRCGDDVIGTRVSDWSVTINPLAG